MPRNKKHIFDDRDALEILRDAFLDTEPARVAELQSPPTKTRTVGIEEPTADDIFNQKKAPGKRQRAGKQKKRDPYDINSLNEEETAQNAIDTGLVDTIRQRIEDLGEKRAELSEEDHAQLEEIRRRYEEQIKEGGTVPATETSPLSPSLPTKESETKPAQVDQSKIEAGANILVEVMLGRKTLENKIAGIEAWTINMKNEAEDEERKRQIEEIAKRAIELVKLQTQEVLPSPPEPPKLDISEYNSSTTPEQPAKSEEEKRLAGFEKRITELETRINGTGGTPEEKAEHLALKKAKECNYSVSEINTRIDELKKEPAGNTIEVGILMNALILLDPESTSKRVVEPPPVEPPPVETTPADVDKTFEEFGISKTDLASVEGFSTLNDNQKAFVLDNLRRVLYGDIETKAQALLAEETSKMSVTRRTGRKAFEGFAGQGGKLRVKELEALQAIRTGGIAAHGETLRLLIQMTSSHEIVKNPDTGALEIAYINPSEFGPEHAKVIENYNNAARQFANTPEAWGYSRASKKEHAQHEAARLEYDNARRAMFALAHAKEGDFASASEFMLQRDSQVNMHRILAGCPQLEAILSNVERIENQSVGKAAAWSTVKESGWKGGIAGMGFLSRWQSVAYLGLSATEAALGIGAIINSVRSAYQARTKAREEFMTAQQNLTRKELAELGLKTGRGLLGIGKKEKARLAGHTFRKTDFIDASNYNTRIQKLLEKINDPANEKNAMNQRHLHRLVAMAEEHLAEGLVNFGKGSTRLFAAHEFSTNLANARVELARRNWTDQKNAIPNLTYTDTKGGLQKTSLPAFMNAKLGRMTKEEKKFILRGFTRGLAVGAVAGGVGALFGGWVKDRFGDDINTWFGKGKTPSTPKNLPVAPETRGAMKLPPSTPEAKVPSAIPPASPSPTETIPGGRGNATVPQVEDATPVTSPIENNPEYAKLAEIKKGGIWHAVRHQLNYQMANTSPEEFAKRYGLKAEDIQLHPKESVERITGKLLVDQGYIKPNGGGSEQILNGKNTYQWRKPGSSAWTETRIAKPGVHVFLGEDGKIEISDTGKTIPAEATKIPKPTTTPGARPRVPSSIKEALDNAERAMDRAETAASRAEATINAQKGVPATSPISTPHSNVPPAYGGREGDFTLPANTNEPVPTRTPIGADKFGTDPESGLLADGSDGATTEEYKALRGMGPTDDEFRKGFAPDRAPTAQTLTDAERDTMQLAYNDLPQKGMGESGFAPDRAPSAQALTDAQREAMQLNYQGLPEKGAGEVMGRTKETSPIDPMGLGDEMMKRSGVFPHPEDVTSRASALAPAEITPEATPLSDPVKHAIGKRGPEGAIIDEFRNNPELAKQFGWDGKKNINTWAGKEADVLYKAFRKESLGNPKIVEEMEKLGYKPTPKGHESMMHRIKSGTIELDPTTKSFTLKDAHIIKASETATLLSGAEKTVQEISGLDLNKYAKVRDTSLTTFLKKPPRGEAFEILAKVLQKAEPTPIEMKQSISEFLTNRFAK